MKVDLMNIFMAELVGTMILVLLGNGVVANVVLKGSKGESSGWIVIAAGDKRSGGDERGVVMKLWW